MAFLQIQHITQNNPVVFGAKLKLEEKTIDLIEKRTRLSYNEMRFLPLDETTKLMRKRAPIREKIQYTSREIRLLCGKIYKNIGEKLGLLEKQRNIYTDIH